MASTLVILSLAGCNKSGSKVVEPAVLTPEQVAADVQNQNEAAAAEETRQVSLPKSPKGGQSAAENSERRRQNVR